MKNRTISILAIIISLCLPTFEADANFFKKLGKAIEKEGKKIIDNVSQPYKDIWQNGKSSTNTSSSSSPNNNTSIDFPSYINIELLRLVRVGEGARAEFMITNNASTDIYYSMTTRDNIAADKNKDAYELWLMSDYYEKLFPGQKKKLSYQIYHVPKNIESFTAIIISGHCAYNEEELKKSSLSAFYETNVPIKESSFKSGINTTWNDPDLNVELLSTKRSATTSLRSEKNNITKNITIKLSITNNTRQVIKSPFNSNNAAVLGSNNEIYSAKFDSDYRKFHPGEPMTVTLTIFDVPVGVKSLKQVYIGYGIKELDSPSPYNNTSSERPGIYRSIQLKNVTIK